MPSPRRRRLKKLLRAGLLKAAGAAEAAAEVVAPAPVEPPAPLVDAPVVEEVPAPKKAAPNKAKKAPKKKTTRSKPYRLSVQVNGEEFKTEAKDLETALTEFVNSEVFPLGAKTKAFVKYSKGTKEGRQLWNTPKARRVFRTISLKPDSLSLLATKLTEQLNA